MNPKTSVPANLRRGLPFCGFPFRAPKMGIRLKMLLSFSLVIIVFISFMLYFAVIKYGEKLTGNNIGYANQVIGNLIWNLDNHIRELKNITKVAQYNYYIQNYLNLLQKQRIDHATATFRLEYFEKSIELFTDAINTNRDITSIFIVGAREPLMFKSVHPNIDTAFAYQKQPWFQKALAAEGDPVITGPHRERFLKDNDETVFSISRAMNSLGYLDQLGVILVDVNLSVIKNLCDSAKLGNNGMLYIVNQSGQIIYQPAQNTAAKTGGAAGGRPVKRLFQKVLPEFARNIEGTFTAKSEGVKYQLVYGRMDTTAWTVVAVTPYQNVIADANNIMNLIIIVGLISLILILAITYLLSFRITNPIITLKNYMDQADQGNLDIRANIRTNDEIDMLANSFNHMLERIETLLKQVVAEQEEKRKSELKALQAQINPHFLYNTLDSIIWMAESKNENIVPITEALSNLFRISLSRGQEMIPLADELDHVRNYLIIQSMRYLNKFDYEITAEAGITGYKTLKIILQPLVENSIYHGIKNKTGPGFIKINAWEERDGSGEGGRLIITVHDDGIGMDPEICDRILHDPSLKSKSKGSGIGVRNVNERIQLYFGKEYGLRFESAPGEGTTAYITLPVIRE